jgi:serine phosphatase RsbU (regulator of sigma subunit)
VSDPSVPPRRSASSYAVGAGLTLLVSLLVWLLIAIGKPGYRDWRALAFSCFVGMSIFGSCLLLRRLGQGGIARFAERWQGPLRALLYFLGGCLGYVVGVPIGAWLFGIDTGKPGATDALMLGTLGALSMAIGLAFYSFGLLTDRLRQSLARLHEAEAAERELALARTIQTRLQPPSQIEGEGFRVAARNLAADHVAGDFYDVFRLADGALGLAVGDVSGKGMGAALIMATVKSRLPLLAAGRTVPETLAALDETLRAELAPREFVALAYGRFEPDTGLLEIGNAGLPDPYLLTAASGPQVLEVPGNRLPLGVRAGVSRDSLRVQLELGARVLFLSDGLPEAVTASGEPLGYDAFLRLLAASGWEAAMSPWLDGLLAAVGVRSSGERGDDWTLLALERVQ